MSMLKRGRGNLPADLTSFVGRRQEASQARQFMLAARLLTLTGPGGIGKTRLALHLAHKVRRAFPDGVWLVELAAVTEGAAVARAVSAAVELGTSSPRPPLTTLADYLADKQLLLVLDNCEHVLDASAQLAHQLLAAASKLQILATSRQALGVDGEWVMPVPPMPVPPADNPMSPEAAATSEAVQLLAERATARQPDFAVTADNAEAITRICQRLDGIPLAIELAAAWLPVLSLEQILHRLDDQFNLLTRGSRSAQARQQTLRAMIDWSFDLCSPQEQALWARMSVFADGCELEAAEEVCSGHGIAREEILDLIAGLVDKSILSREEYDPLVRYRMPQTIQHYGRDRLRESGEEAAMIRGHRDWYLNLVTHLDTAWFGPGQLEWSTRLRMGQADLRGALDACLSEPTRIRSGLQMAATLWGRCLGHGFLKDDRRWLDRALALDTEPSTDRAKALWAKGWLVLLQGDTESGHALLAECRALAQQLGDPLALAQAAQLAGLSALMSDNLPTAITALDNALDRYRSLGLAADEWGTTWLLALACTVNDDPRARAFGAQCLDLSETHQAPLSTSHALWITALQHWRAGEPQKATALARKALRLKQPFNDQLGIALCLDVLAWTAAADGRYQHAAILLGAGQMLWLRSGAAPSAVSYLVTCHDECRKLLHRTMGERALTDAVSQGMKLSHNEAITYALYGKTTANPTAAGPFPQDTPSLTRRELQVADLVTQGLSNKEIAAKLVISQRTAEGHVEHILTKLGFTSRAQIAAWAAAHTTPAPATAKPPRR
ncbi:ATP-binding protein [Streptomyces sp.]|uniref:ATP-binding protein n=1 Tax=Streptomyces sp. TaxID=1931 RepID=UPI002D7759B3|nr:LuxR C-terminal-related transcriptional regulator [Streptomyces sp.]HET6358910.1 LuxR C-terminal-related transcriptional regulator [Streptomyces sp.]